MTGASAPPTVHGGVTVRSYLRAHARGLGAGTDLTISRTADHTERTSAAFFLADPADPAGPVEGYAAVRGCSGSRVRRASDLAQERLGRTWAAPAGLGGADEELVPLAATVPAPERLVREVAAHLPSGAGLSAAVEAHRSVDHRMVFRPGRPPVGETLRTASVVVDLFRDGRLLADVDVAWGDAGDPDPGLLLGRLERALARTAARSARLPDRVQLLLLEGTAGVFLHEVCGHLLESTAARPSLVADATGRQIAADCLNVWDDPRRAGSFSAHGYTMAGVESRRRALLDGGRLTELLADTPDGPWRAEHAGRVPRPRMSHLELAPAWSGASLDRALGRTRAPVVRVHRFGVGSLDHRGGTVVIEVKEATVGSGRAARRLDPFRVTAEARRLLLEIQAVGDVGTEAEWSAYCHASSGRVPVGATTPTLLTGVLATLPHSPAATAAA